MLARTPGFTAVAVLTLALGIGANTAIFTLLDQVLLRLLPVKDPQQLVLLTMRGRHYGSNWGGNAVSHPMFRDFREHNEVFSDMFCRFPNSASLSFGQQSERVSVELVSGTYFSTLGVVPALGRILTPEDDVVPSGHPYVVLNYSFWKTRFASDPQIVGKTLNLNNYKMTVVGVAQEGFDGVELGFSPNLFVPIMMQAQIILGNPIDMLKERRNRWVNAFGRLKPGVSQQQAKAALQPFMHSMLEMEVRQAAFSHASAYDRQEFLKCWIDVLPGSQGRSYTRRQLSTPLWVLMATTGAVLLIACANLANLMLVRGSGRVKEIAVRLAMGATRPRIIGQLLIESLSLSALGGLAALAFAFWADRALMKIYLPSDSGGMNISSLPDFRILLFNLAVTVLTGVFFGLVPALQTTKPNIAGTLKDRAGAVVGGGHHGLRKALVIAQVTLSLLLLVGAGLFVRSLANLRNLGPGFAPERLVAFQIDPSLNGYTTERMKIFYPQLSESLSSIPGVQSVGLASVRILEDNEWDSSMSAEGFTPAKPDEHAEPYMNAIGPNYFATLGVPIVAGRDFRTNDNHEVKHGPEVWNWSPTTVMINEKFAKKYFSGRNPIGVHLGFGTDPEVDADGIPSGEVFFGKLLVDHDRCGRPVPHFRPVFDLVVVVGPEVAARDDGHPEGGKIIRANGVHVGLGVLIGLRRSEALGGHAAVPLVVFENAHGGEADGLNSRNGTERFGELRIENLHALCSVAVERRVDLEGHEPLRGKAGPEIAQVRKTANEKTGSYQEQEGKRHLRDDKGFSQAIVAAAANDSSGLVLQCSCDVGLGGLKSRYEAEDDSGEDGHGEVEEKNAKIGRAGNVHAAGIGRQIDFHKGAVGPERKG